MKKNLLLLLLLMSFFSAEAQDTIFVRNGQVIPAIIIEKTGTEIKYKRPGQENSPAIYSVLISDIRSIHYKDGIIADYTATGTAAGNRKIKAVEYAGTMKAMKLGLGINIDYFNRSNYGDLLVFWQNRVGPTGKIENNGLSYPLNFKFGSTIGYSGRSIFNGELMLELTAPDAIYAFDELTDDEIKLGYFFYIVSTAYGHTLNHKKSIFAMLEPGVDFAMMNGYFYLNDKKYKNSLNLGVGFHIATGLDWIISKRFSASLRVGQRFLKVKEQHESDASSTGYANLYVLPGQSEELLVVKSNGQYLTFGLTYSFYTKIKAPGIE